jgi:hypothetical protein
VVTDVVSDINRTAQAEEWSHLPLKVQRPLKKLKARAARIVRPKAQGSAIPLGVT